MNKFLAALLLCLALAGCRTVPSKPHAYAPGELPKVINLSTNAPGYVRSVQTAPDTYVLQSGRRVFSPAKGSSPEIELLGAVHVAEPAYFQALQRRMDAAGLVLYEGVADERDQPPVIGAKTKSLNPTYDRLADSLGLIDQINLINYQQTNFVHCDMSLQQMRARLEREKSLGGPSGRTAAAALKEFSNLENLLGGHGLLVNIALWAIHHSHYLKAFIRLNLVIMPANQETDKVMSPRLHQLILADRNDYVLHELDRILGEKPRSGRVVIFFGCDHLAGLEQGLRARGYQPAGPVEWEDAVADHPFAEGLDQSDIDQALKPVNK